jgi:hypothetical protein
VKRIHLIGKSDDEKSLIFAATKGGRRGSFEVPITKKLRELVAEEVAPSSEAGEEETLMPGRDHVRVLPTPSTAQPAASMHRKTRGLAPGAFEKATGFGSGVPELRGVRALIGGGETAPGERRVGLAAVPEPPDAPADRSLPASGGSERALTNPEHPASDTLGTVPPARGRQKMTAAEMQVLLRAGQSVRSVAKRAGATLEWVTRLDETIQMERIAVVRQLLGAHLTRDRLGESEAPVAEAIMENLRKRRVRFPERVLETGWSASRLRGKEWRVRFTYRYRDKPRRADWGYDPKTGELLALNEAGAELAWVPPQDPGGRSGRRGRNAGRLKRRP